MQKAQNSGGVFVNGVAILEFGSGRVKLRDKQARHSEPVKSATVVSPPG
jgi:hypothetical protein